MIYTVMTIKYSTKHEYLPPIWCSSELYQSTKLSKPACNRIVIIAGSLLLFTAKMMNATIAITAMKKFINQLPTSKSM